MRVVNDARPARILIISTIGAFLRAFMLPFAEFLRNRGWEVHAAASRVSEYPELTSSFNQVHPLPFSRGPLAAGNVVRGIAAVRRLVAAGNYDIVHTHTPIASFVVRCAVKSLPASKRPRVLYTAHGFHFHPLGGWLHNHLFLWAEILAGNWTDYLTVMNATDYEAALEHRLVPPGRLRHVPGIGVDCARYDRGAVSKATIAALKTKIGLQEEEKLLLCIAELIPRKRPDIPLCALEWLSTAPVKLAYAGDGPLAGKLQESASKKGLAHKVRFLGFRKDIPELLACASILLLASEHEGLPKCVMEAMCMETPVVARDIRGTRDLLADGRGVLVNSAEPREFARAVRATLASPRETRAMTARAKHHINQLSEDKIFPLYEALYIEAIHGTDFVTTRERPTES